MFDPESVGWELIGSVDWDDEPYQFDETVVYHDAETGQYRWADDSGCSCPMPFEDHSEADYSAGSKYDVLNYLAGHHNSGAAMDLIERIQRF